MLTINQPVAEATRASKFTITILSTVALLALLVTWHGTVLLALVYCGFVLVGWVIMETLAVTVLLHRYLTHGSYELRNRRVLEYWLWWARNGGVKFREWVSVHLWHHANSDRPPSRGVLGDPHSPHVGPRLSYGHGSLSEGELALPTEPLPSPFWRFWLNGLRYYSAAARVLRERPELLEDAARQDRSVQDALDRLDQLAWAEEVYHRTGRGLWLSWLAFTIAAAPLAVQTGWWGMLVFLGLPWLMIGIKYAAYLAGGQIINFYGHQGKGEQKQSNVPMWLRLPSMWVMGEAWHELHHDAPFSARFHRIWDPGWWVIYLMYLLGWADKLSVADPSGKPRQYYIGLYSRNDKRR